VIKQFSLKDNFKALVKELQVFQLFANKLIHTEKSNFDKSTIKLLT